MTEKKTSKIKPIEFNSAEKIKIKDIHSLLVSIVQAINELIKKVG